MKKIVLAAFVALLATPLFAASSSDISLDINAGYFKPQDGGNGFGGGVAGYYSVMKDSGILQNLGVGLAFDLGHVSGGNFIFVGPEAKLSMPYSYAKLGFGMSRASASVDVLGTSVSASSTGLGMKLSLGGVMPIAEGMSAGLNFTFGEKLSGGTAWTIVIGPVFSMDL
jgi:hypothetical protein